MNQHDRRLAEAFDAQAPKFERAPVQSDPAALERLVRAAALPAGGLILDAGCGPGWSPRPCWRRACGSWESTSRAR